MPALLWATTPATDNLILQTLVQLLVVIAAARAGGWLLGRLGQPQVMGEILAGLLLGPSCLGRIAPGWERTLFAAGDLDQIMHVLSEIGLVWLMFLVGIDSEFSHLRKVGRTAVVVSLVGIAFPLLLGFGLGWFLHPATAMPPHVPVAIDRLSFVLFFAVSLSITALPVLGRIVHEFGLHRTHLGTLTITAAALGDAIGWILLAAVIAAVHQRFDPLHFAQMVGLALAFVALVLGFLKPLLTAYLRHAQQAAQGNPLPLQCLGAIVLSVLLCAIATNWIGIYSILGPFVLGAALSDQPLVRDQLTSKLRDFVTIFFLPIFFTYTGLRTNIALLDSPRLWAYCGLVLLAAFAGKALACGLAARAAGKLSWPDAAAVATLMNTRGLMELVVINLGRDLGVLPDSVFCMLVIMAIVTTFMASPILTLLPRLDLNSQNG